MKQLIPLFFIAILPVVAFSQNWQPLVPGNYYHYQADGDSLVITLWVDSTSVVGDDSVFYLNRRVGKPVGDSWFEEYRLLDQPHFLMKEMIREGDSAYRFQDSTTFYLPLTTEIGQSFSFNPERSLTATLVSFKDSLLGGQLDSIRTYQLSDGQEMVWSKQWGILSFAAFAPDSGQWRLIGIEGRDFLGVQVPKYDEFFVWEVGDVLEYQYSARGMTQSEIVREKLELLGKMVLNDSCIAYSAARFARYSGFWGPVDFAYNERDTISFTLCDSSQHHVNRYSFEVFEEEVEELYDSYSFVRVYRRSDGSWIKALGNYESPFDYESWGHVYFVMEGDTLKTTYYGWTPYGGVLYRTGQGLVHEYLDYQLSEHLGDSVLVAYQTATDTFGTLSPDSALIVSIRLSDERELSLKTYPNSFSRTLNLQWDTQVLGTAQTFLLQNAQGQTVLRRRLSGPEARWELPELPGGVYYLRIEGHAGGVALRRL